MNQYMNTNQTPAAGQIGGLSESPCSAIPAIQSAALNLGTAARDADNALECWDEEKWDDAVMWINNAISQLESARAKIMTHASLRNDKAHESRAGGKLTMETDTKAAASDDNQRPKGDGYLERLVRYASVTWKMIPADVAEDIARAKALEHCVRSTVRPHNDEEWNAGKHNWLRLLRGEHARLRSRLANAKEHL